MPDIKIEFREVEAKAKEIRTHNGNLKAILEEIKTKITSLSEVYTSDASDTIRAKIQGEEKRILEYEDIIESYAAFLERTASRYENMEGVVRSNAESQFT